MNKSNLKEMTIREKLDADNSTEPVLMNKDNGTQTFEDSKIEKVTAPIQVEGAASMDNTDPSGVKYDYIETPVVVREMRIIDESISKKGYKELLERYEKQNPKKFAAKKAELERKMKEVK